MLLAAGSGERMRPLTDGRAKPSLPLLNRPIIVHTLDYLRRQGVREVVINLHHSPESIRAVVGDGSRVGLRVHYSEEISILGTAGGLKRAEAHFRDAEHFLMINSDFSTDCDLRAAVRKHRESNALATMVLAPLAPDTDYGVVEMGAHGRIQRIAGRPGRDADPRAGRYLFTGVHVLHPGILDAIPDRGRVEINRDIYPALIGAGREIRGHVHSGFWREFGTPRHYLEGQIAMLRERMDPSLLSRQVAEGVYLDQVVLPAGTLLEPPVLVGRGTVIGRRCSLQGGAVIGKQARIGTSCALRSTIVWDGARIGDGARLSGCIVTSGVLVPDGLSLSDRIVLRVEGYQGRKDLVERLGSCYVASI